VDLLTVGEAFEDVVFAGLPRLPRLGEELRVRALTRHPGGGALITAIAAARLGVSVSTITAVSRDNAAHLRAEGIGIVNLQEPSERGAVSVALSTKRDRAFVTFPGVNEVLEPRLIAAVRRLRRVPRHAHFALSPRRCRNWLSVVERMRTRGITTSWDFGWNADLLKDPALDQLLGAVDWLFVNEREATLYARRDSMKTALTRWRRLARNTVVKLGRRGALVLCDGSEVRRPARKVSVVDTTGAGDAFNAGFIVGLLRAAAIGDAARLGNHVGACSTRASGGVTALPRPADLPPWARRMVGSV
jgi:sugar/nucleoside kinase (ribokinase family)